jgi:hypothetical protein
LSQDMSLKTPPPERWPFSCLPPLFRFCKASWGNKVFSSHSPRGLFEFGDGGGRLPRDGEKSQGRFAGRNQETCPGHISIAPDVEISARNRRRNNPCVCGLFSTSRGLDSEAASATPREKFMPGCRAEARGQDGEAFCTASRSHCCSFRRSAFLKSKLLLPQIVALCRETGANPLLRFPASLKASPCMERGRLCSGMPASNPACSTTPQVAVPQFCPVGLEAATEHNSVG